MSLQVEKLEKNMAKLTIEVSADELEKALQNAYKKQKNKISMPGFRKGKVPRQMVEKMYGADVFYEDAANALIPQAYSEAYDECDLQIVSQPEIDITQIEKGKPFIFTALVATRPEVTLGEYKGLEVDKVSTRVTQKEVDAKIQEEAGKNARTVAVEGRPVKDGDEVVLDFEGFVDGEAFEGGKGENYSLTIGSGTFIPGFEDQLIGVEAEKEVEVKVIHGGVGAINESDVILASASNAIIIGFNVKPDAQAEEIATREKVDLRLYSVIYNAIEDIERAMKGMLEPIYEEKVIGHAEIRQIFKASGVGNIAGSYVLDGSFKRGCSARITRDGEQIFDGPLASLKRFKDDVKEVKAGYECGLVFEKFNDIAEGDAVEAYMMVEVPR